MPVLVLDVLNFEVILIWTSAENHFSRILLALQTLQDYCSPFLPYLLVWLVDCSNLFPPLNLLWLHCFFFPFLLALSTIYQYREHFWFWQAKRNKLKSSETLRTYNCWIYDLLALIRWFVPEHVTRVVLVTLRWFTLIFIRILLLGFRFIFGWLILVHFW